MYGFNSITVIGRIKHVIIIRNMDSPQTLFVMYITEAYPLRNTIGIIKSETDYATMILSERLIEISFINTSKCAVHKILLHPQEFTMYRYNIRDEEGNLREEYPIAFETNEFFNTVKNIGRRDGIRIYWLAGDNKINVQPIKVINKDPGKSSALFVNILNMEHCKYDVPTHNPEPNVRVQAKDFAEICSQINTVKCSSLEIIGHNNGVIFNGILPDRRVACTNRFTSQTPSLKAPMTAIGLDRIDEIMQSLHVGDSFEAPVSTGLTLNIVRSDDIVDIRVPISTVKALSKIHNISPPGTLLRFFFTYRTPIKIESPISTYGLYIICLRDSSA